MTSSTSHLQVVKPGENSLPLTQDPAAKLEHDLRAISPKICALIEKAEMEKLLRKPMIVLVEDTPQGAYDVGTRQILVNKNQQHDAQLSFIIFELINIEREPEFARVDAEARRGLHTKETYGEAIERIEYANTFRYHDLVQGLPKEFVLSFSFSSFSEYLQTQMSRGHTQYYHQMYEQNRWRYLGPQAVVNPVGKLARDLQNLSPQVSALIQKARSLLGKFPTLVLVDDVPGVSYDAKTQQILINKNLKHNKQLSLIIFELLHIEKQAEFASVENEARRGMHTKETYGEAVERIEYEILRTHHGLVRGLHKEFNCLCSSSSFSKFVQEEIASGRIKYYYEFYEQSGFRYSGPVQTDASG